jgi:hypothetical protein
MSAPHRYEELDGESRRLIDTNMSAHETRRIAVAACVDPRTVRRVLAGKPVTSTTQARVNQALKRLGYSAEVPEEAGGGLE